MLLSHSVSLDHSLSCTFIFEGKAWFSNWISFHWSFCSKCLLLNVGLLSGLRLIIVNQFLAWRCCWTFSLCQKISWSVLFLWTEIWWHRNCGSTCNSFYFLSRGYCLLRSNNILLLDYLLWNFLNLYFFLLNFNKIYFIMRLI